MDRKASVVAEPKLNVIENNELHVHVTYSVASGKSGSNTRLNSISANCMHIPTQVLSN